MSSECSEFDQIWAEAFTAIMPNVDNNPTPRFTDELGDFTRKFSHDYYMSLALHVDNDYETPFGDIRPHPAQCDFGPEDIERIAKVKYFGREIINTAKQGIISNGHFDPITKKSDTDALDEAMVRLQFAQWYQQHHELAKDRSQDPVVFDPHRIADWPAGEYINCLGISIATSAIAEVTGTDYLYANEIVTAQSVINHLHHAQVALLEALPGGLLKEDQLSEFLNLVNRTFLFNGSGFERYMKIMISETEAQIMSIDQALPRDFHHYSVWRQNEDNSSLSAEDRDGNAVVEWWAQVDPYAITSNGVAFTTGKYSLPTHHTANIIDHRRDGGIREAFRDGVQAIEHLRISPAMRILHEMLDESSKEYKTKGFLTKIGNCFDNLADELVEFYFPHVVYMPDKRDISSLTLKRMYSDTFDIAVMMAYKSIYGVDEKYKNWQELLEKAEEERWHDEQSLKAYFDGVFAMFRSIEEYIKSNGQFRDTLFAGLRQVPQLVGLLHHIDLLGRLEVKSWGMAGVAAEFCDPEFMVGAMSLNHYATWRKDGRVNIARHLARISSSQLLWQAAQQDGEVDDERIHAMTEVVNALKERYVHPLVIIARSLNPNKGDASGQAEKRNIGGEIHSHDDREG